MSLRLRLLLSLLALAAVGLVIVDAVSYSSLRSHLLQRVDQQVESARAPATVALLAQPSSKPFRKLLQAGSAVAGPGPPEGVGTGGIVRGGGEVHVPGPGAPRPGTLQAPPPCGPRQPR